MRLSLRGLIIAFGALAACVPWLISSSVSNNTNFANQEQAIKQDITRKGRDAATRLARTLDRRWVEVQALAHLAETSTDHDIMRVRLDTTKAISQQYAWLGVANTDGVVTVATDDILVGQSVKARLWFSGGLQHPYFGDVHEAVLLQRYIAPDAKEPQRLIDFATPLRRPDGATYGVLGAHLSWNWLRDLLRDLTPRGTDILLVARDGIVQLGPDELEGKPLDTPSALAARQGADATEVETWPDGKPYLVSTVPAVTYKDLPDLGWSLIIRQDAASLVSAFPQSARPGNSALALTGIAIFALALTLALFVSVPLRRLSAAAASLADPRRETPPMPEERAYQETATLSAALVQLQSRLGETEQPDAALRRSA